MVGKGGLIVVSKRVVGNAVAQVATDLRLDLLRALLAARWGYYTRQPLGLVTNAIATEADRASLAYHFMAQVVAGVFESAIYLAIALAISWQVALAAAVAGLLSALSLSSLVRVASRAGRRQTQLLKKLSGRVADSLQAVKLLKAMGRERLIGPLLEHDNEKLNRALRNRIFSKEALRALQEPILSVFALGGIVGVWAFGVLRASEMLVMGYLFAATLNKVNLMQRKYQQMVSETSALDSLREMTGRARSQVETREGRRPPTLERGLELRGVVVEYDGTRVLDGCTLEIPAGLITALVGDSGAGKTTLIDLVVGLVQPRAGAVLVDGVPLSELDMSRWRKLVGYVPQEMLLLHDTIRTNVTLGDPELTDADAERALRDAGAWDFVQRLPEGLDATVGERGALLSGGQRQRIAIARALAHRPRLLILDEATAALDPETEGLVWDAMQRLRGRTTVVAISHQPSLAGVADRIYRIDKGTATPLSAAARAAGGASRAV